MAEKKYTQRDFLTDVINGVFNETVTGYAQERLDKLDEKNEKRKAETSANQLKNAQLLKDFVAFIAEKGEPQTTTEIARHFNLSTQKVAPIMANGVKSESVTETTKKIDGRKYKAYTV
jgi:response regulator of citrate/malate metabolism